MTTNEPTKHVSADLPESLHRALKVKLAGDGKTFNDWVREHAAADTADLYRQPRRRPAKQ